MIGDDTVKIKTEEKWKNLALCCLHKSKMKHMLVYINILLTSRNNFEEGNGNYG